MLLNFDYFIHVNYCPLFMALHVYTTHSIGVSCTWKVSFCLVVCWLNQVVGVRFGFITLRDIHVEILKSLKCFCKSKIFTRK